MTAMPAQRMEEQRGRRGSSTSPSTKNSNSPRRRATPRRSSSILSSPDVACGDRRAPPRRSSSVSFSEPVVSDIADICDLLDDCDVNKSDLFYDSEEIRLFKKKFHARRVRFGSSGSKTPTLEFFTRPYHTKSELRGLFYTANDVLRFENEFLQSLNKSPSSGAGGKHGANVSEASELHQWNTTHAIKIITTRRMRKIADATCCGSFGGKIHKMCPIRKEPFDDEEEERAGGPSPNGRRTMRRRSSATAA